MLTVGVIGVGHIGKIHAGVYASHPSVDFRCVCDIDAARAAATAEPFGVRSYTSVPEMLQNERLDAVSVATAGFENGSFHFTPTMQCFEAGVHVLCEKPISNNIEEARQMVRAAREKNLYFGVNLNHRFVPPAAAARRWIEEQRLGDLLLINMTLWIDNPNEASPWLHLRALHPHSIDVMRYFCGPIKSVHAFMNRAPGRNVWSNAQINLMFENGVIGHLTGSYDAGMRHNLERCEVMGTEGRFVLENCFEELTFYPRRSEEITVLKNSIFGGITGFDDTFRARLSRWIQQVDEKAPREEIEASGEDGLAVQEVIEAAIQSHETGMVVSAVGAEA